MAKRLVISVPQMFSLLFISRLVVEITYSGVMADGNSLWDHILSAGISFIVVFLLIIPVYFLFSMDKSMDIIDNSYLLLGKFGYLVSAIYAVYFLFICVQTLSLFKIFLVNVINPSIPIFLLLITMSLAACYGAYKGVEGLVRTAGVILVFIVSSLVFIGISLFTDIDIVNLKPFLYNGTESMLGGIMFMISRSSCIPAMAILFPMAKGDAKKGIIVWNTSIYALIAIVIVLMVGAMGDFIQTQLFPVYTAASIARIGSLEHLDALYLGIWTMGIFIKMSLFLMLSGECMKKIVGEKVGKISVIIFGLLIAISGYSINKNNIVSGIFSTNFLLWSMIITGVILPIICIVLRVIKLKGRKIQHEI